VLKFKRIAAVIMVAALLLCSFNVSADTDSDFSASAVLESKAVVSGMKIRVGPDGAYAYEAVNKDGRPGWTIKPHRSENSAIYVNVDKNVAYNIKDYSSFEVEVDYYDEGNGQFRIMYDSMPEPWESGTDKSKAVIAKSEIVKLSDTSEWLTHRFIIENPKFKGGYNNSDFAITIYEDAMGISLANVTFGAIRFKPADTKSTVRVKLTSDNIGHNYFSEENVVINMEAYNLSDKDEKVNVSVESYDFYNVLSHTDSFELEIPAMDMVEKKIEYKPDRYQLYTMFVKVNGDGIYSSQKIEYSYVYETEKDNMFMGVCNHYLRLDTRQPDKIIPLMDKIGIGWNRNGVTWQDYEATKGVYQVPEFAQEGINIQNKHGIDYYMTLGSWMPDTRLYPVGEENEARFLEYVRHIAEEFNGVATTYELFNELNQATQEGVDTVWYGRLIRETYRILKEINPDNKLIICTTSGVPLQWIKDVCIQADNHFDGVSIHPYGMKVSPVDSGRYSAILSARELLDSIGHADKPLYVSEFGFSTGWVDYEHQAAYLAQAYAILSSPELNIANFMYYDFHDDGYKPEDQENNFGMTRTWEVVDTPFLAKPSYITTSTINRFLTDAKQVDRKFEDNVSMYRYKATGGNDVLMVWSQNENDYTTIDIGNDNAVVYNMFGNEIDLYRKDGKYSLCLDHCPVYIVGDIDRYVLSKPVFEISNTVFDLPYDDQIDITITQSVDSDAGIELVLNEKTSIDIVENKGFVDGKAVIKVHGTGKTGLSEEARLIVKSKEGTIYVDETLLFNFTDMLSVDFKTKLFDAGNLNRWIGIMTVKNHNHVRSISGKAVFNGPSSITDYIKYIQISEIAPDDEEVIYFNMPEVKYCSSYFIDMDIVLDDGYKQNFSVYADCLVATHIDEKPVIDGYVTGNEWSGTKPLKIGADNMYISNSNGTYDGDNDLSAEMMFKWDEENMYMLAKVTDDVMSQLYSGAVIWKGDCIQFGIHYGGVIDPTVQLFTEIGLALTPNGSDIQRYSNEQGASGVNKDAKLATRREGSVTYYELSMPWAELIMDGTKLESGDAVRFNVIVNDCDGTGRYGWLEYSYGIGTEKDGSYFGRMNLIDNR